MYICLFNNLKAIYSYTLMCIQKQYTIRRLYRLVYLPGVRPYFINIYSLRFSSSSLVSFTFSSSFLVNAVFGLCPFMGVMKARGYPENPCILRAALRFILNRLSNTLLSSAMKVISAPILPLLHSCACKKSFLYVRMSLLLVVCVRV